MTFMSVSELTGKIKNIIENNALLNNIWVKGEIYNLTYHSSGHIYFTLKDEGSVISAVFFKYANKNLKFRLEEGMSILALGSITVFNKRGSYQINISSVRLHGEGELQQSIDKLRKKLHAEGVFNEEFKKALPFLPKRLGIVTSPTGAAVKDIIKVALRRYSNIEIIIAPALVQGEGAEATIVRGIEELNKPEHKIDLIIAGRGGGSFEDLLPFNTEPVVRAFFNSRVPIISAVGHQIDHPLSDDAADVFAPTPSAAAEIAIPLKDELSEEVDYLLTRMENALIQRTERYRQRVETVENKKIFQDPFQLINYREMQLTDVEKNMTLGMKDTISLKKQNFLKISDINKSMASIITERKHRYSLQIQALEKLSPLNIMKRGYSLVMDDNGTVIKSANNLKINDEFNIKFTDGEIRASVIKNRGEGA